jgi:hypothetical protein
MGTRAFPGVKRPGSGAEHPPHPAPRLNKETVELYPAQYTTMEKKIGGLLTNKEIYAILKKPTLTETIRLHRLRWFGHVQRMEENRIPKRVLYMNLETRIPRGRPRNRWQDEVREDGRLIGGEEWHEKVYDREEWKKLLRTARNRRILHMPMQ